MKHLIFHITPLDTPAAQACCRWHFRQLQQHAHVFDGQWIFAVAAGQGLLAPEIVAKWLPPQAQVLVVPNHPEIRETYSLPLLLAKAFTIAPDDSVFYAHTKGLAWLGHASEAPTRWWSLAMYRWLFSDEALAMLKTYPFVGWLRCDGPIPHFPPQSTWHYAGTFWWFRAHEIYRRPWWCVAPTRYGAEAYPSGIIPATGAACKYNADQIKPSKNGICLYDLDFWQQIGIPMGRDADRYDAPAI